MAIWQAKALDEPSTPSVCACIGSLFSYNLQVVDKYYFSRTIFEWPRLFIGYFIYENKIMVVF